jgi:hypothetical protein
VSDVAQGLRRGRSYATTAISGHRCVQDIGGHPRVILIVVYRCAIKVVMYNRNQEEKDAFDTYCIRPHISRSRICVQARSNHGTVLLNRSGAQYSTVYVFLIIIQRIWVFFWRDKNRSYLRRLTPLISNLQLSAGYVQTNPRRMSMKTDLSNAARPNLICVFTGL